MLKVSQICIAASVKYLKKKTTTIQKARLTHTSDVQSFGNGCNIVTLLYAGNSSFTFFLLFPSSERNSALGLKVLYLTAAMPREDKGISSIPDFTSNRCLCQSSLLFSHFV